MDQGRFEQIENFLLGKLDDSEQSEFQRQVIENKNLKQEVELLRIILNVAENKSLTEDLESIHQSLYPSSKSSKSIHLWKYISGIAASFAILALFWFFYGEKEYSSADLYNQYYQAFPEYITTRNTQTDKNTEAFLQYSKGEFEEAIQLFKTTDRQSEAVKFYLGMSYMETQNISQAVATFSDLLPGSETYREQIVWYLSLAYLKQGKKENTIQLLSKIDENSFQYEQAKELLILLQK